MDTRHGIYVGDAKVIYCDKEQGVILSSVNEFVSRVSVRNHAENVSPNEIVERAYSQIGESKYNALANSGECFVKWCCTSETVSEPVHDMISIMNLFRNKKNGI